MTGEVAQVSNRKTQRGKILFDRPSISLSRAARHNRPCLPIATRMNERLEPGGFPAGSASHPLMLQQNHS